MKTFALLLLAAFVLFNNYCDAESCIYSKLETALTTNENNKYQLSRAFFPPVDNPPEFVTVRYTFMQSKTQTWYWSTFTSSFIHPPEVMQFMSLFFGKPHAFFAGEVELDLTNESIVGCDDDLEQMQLLTQRVSNYC